MNIGFGWMGKWTSAIDKTNIIFNLFHNKTTIFDLWNFLTAGEICAELSCEHWINAITMEPASWAAYSCVALFILWHELVKV